MEALPANVERFWLGLVLGAGRWGCSDQRGPAAAGRDDNPSTWYPLPARWPSICSISVNPGGESHVLHDRCVVERMQMRGIAFAAENRRDDVPASSSGPNIYWKPGWPRWRRGRTRWAVHHRLISNWAINAKNRPMTDFERAGLTEILVNPDQPYTAVTTEAGPLFSSLYADKAASHLCIGCHNAHPNSPKKDFKSQDVMGGICSPFRCRSR